MSERKSERKVELLFKASGGEVDIFTAKGEVGSLLAAIVFILHDISDSSGVEVDRLLETITESLHHVESEKFFAGLKSEIMHMGDKDE